VVAFLGLLLALAALVAAIDVRYRDGLEEGVRTDLTAGAAALRAAPTPAALKYTVNSLAAQGISVDIAGTTARGGTLGVTRDGALLSIRELVPVDGRPVAATLTASRAGIDRQVHGLWVTEAIGGAITLALLAALAVALLLLARAVADARASEAAMRAFLADASHELRTPVAALQASAERLLRDQPPRPARDEVEAQLARDSRRLGQLIDDLLSLARLDARERPGPEPIDLAGLAATAVEASRAAHPEASVELRADAPLVVDGDREALARAIGNLLDNGLAVSDAVEVEVRSTAEGAAVSVADDGPGVPADQRGKVFEPFFRLPGSPRGGTGLGLSIVRRTMEAHGGSVTCDLSAAGGARFTLRLPAEPGAATRPGPDLKEG
jgi:signal transduction histidine kinase